MNLVEFAGHCAELGLVGPSFGHRSSRLLFMYCQQNEDVLGEDEADNCECTFFEYKELITAIAMWLTPNPCVFWGGDLSPPPKTHGLGATGQPLLQ